MKNPFRVYYKIKVKHGNLDEFLTIIPKFVEIIQLSEQNTLQFEAFCNREKGEVVWLQSYANAEDFDDHIGNAGLKDLQLKMATLQEAMLDLYIMDKPTEATIETLTNYNLNPIILNPWPGTNRLTEPRDENANIQSIVAFELTDLDAYRKISEKVETAAAKQSGVAFHRSYQTDNNSIVAFEEYANEQAVLDWIPVFSTNAGNFGELVTSITYNVFGNPTGECKKTLDGFGAIYYEKISGFVRFDLVNSNTIHNLSYRQYLEITYKGNYESTN